MIGSGVRHGADVAVWEVSRQERGSLWGATSETQR